jgi:hypothetical protein
VNSISGNLALWDQHAELKKNQTKPKVSRLSSNVCYFQKESYDFGKETIPYGMDLKIYIKSIA